MTHLAFAQWELVSSVKACVPRPPSHARLAAKAQMRCSNHLLSWGHEAASRGVWARLWSAWGTRDVVSALRDPWEKPILFLQLHFSVQRRPGTLTGSACPSAAISDPAGNPLAGSEELDLPLQSGKTTSKKLGIVL